MGKAQHTESKRNSRHETQSVTGMDSQGFYLVLKLPITNLKIKKTFTCPSRLICTRLLSFQAFSRWWHC